jgi:hypothetical protein
MKNLHGYRLQDFEVRHCLASAFGRGLFVGTPRLPPMELLALAAISLMSVIGWVVATECLGKWIDHEIRFYFAPALGMATCAIVAYVASSTRQTWLIPMITLVALAAFVRYLVRKRPLGVVTGQAGRLLFLSLLTFLCLYGMQINLFYLFKAIYPGPNEVWDLFSATGITPPDQMFGWHQAMFADLSRHYPQDPFYGDSDLYDRPRLGGFVTLFFFKLFHLPLTEDHYNYPAMALRFYHCLGWSLNNLYLFAIAPLFQRLFGYRGAVLAVSATALSGFVVLCNLGGWMKFAALYPFLLAVVLFIDGRGPVLQAGLCAISYYLHASILPFLLGFGLFQIVCAYYPIRPTLARLRDVASFAFCGVVLVGAWFVVVRSVGSKQPLLYYYLYDAGLTQAQTQPVSEIAKAFYAKYSWLNLSLLSLENLKHSIWPTHFVSFVYNCFSSRAPCRISDLAAMLFDTQRHCILAATGLTALPVVILGAIKALSGRYAGRTILTLYLIPSLLMALLYRKHWSFNLHIMCLYHTFALFLWVSILGNGRSRFVALGLAALALEGTIWVFFSDVRFLPVHGIHFGQLTEATVVYVLTYLSLILVILGMAWREMNRLPSVIEIPETSQPGVCAGNRLLVAGRKILIGLVIVALTIAGYSLYCLQFY